MAEVLIVDDSKVMREMIAACLRPDTRLVTSQAASGLEALERLSLQGFDLLVLDLNMPDIGGLEVIEFVRGQDGKLSTLPILIVTTRDEDHSRTQILNAGATDYMTKPFAPEGILSSVQSLLESKHHHHHRHQHPVRARSSPPPPDGAGGTIIGETG